ncbi:hypothetical protein CTI14_57160, partial [Methylobacterium radiotolerans]
ANAFYSAAAQAGSQNWEAFFFGSSDPGNSITVDKPPASLWIVDLSVRLFGLSSASSCSPRSDRSPLPVEPQRQRLANAFYSAAAQAGSQNWEAFFFGSSDPGNSITV